MARINLLEEGPGSATIFLQSLTAVACFKRASIIPVSKKSRVSCPNYYFPVAIISTVMKCFERLVMAKVNSCLNKVLNLLQIAYQHKKVYSRCNSLALHSALDYLENSSICVRLLLIDFSSAFNSLNPSVLLYKLQNLGPSTSLFNWILDFLIRRPRSV